MLICLIVIFILIVLCGLIFRKINTMDFLTLNRNVNNTFIQTITNNNNDIYIKFFYTFLETFSLFNSSAIISPIIPTVIKISAILNINQ